MIVKKWVEQMNLPEQLLLLVCLLGAFGQAGVTWVYAQAPVPITLTDQQGKYDAGLHLEILEDPNGILTFEEVRSEALNGRFTANWQTVPNFGLSNATYWFRLRLKNESRQAEGWLLEIADPNINELTLFIPQPHGQGFQVFATGRSQPFNSRPIAHSNFVFPVSIVPQSEIEIYGRAASLPLSLPITVWSSHSFIEAAQIDFLQIGIVFGILLIMAAYNLFLYFSLRDKSYLYYVLLILCLLGLKMVRDGLSLLFFNTDFTLLNVRSELFLFSLLLILLLGFTKSFLLTSTNVPRINRIIILLRYGFVPVVLLLIVFPISLPVITVYLLLALSTLGIVLVSGFITWRGGYKPARFFLLTWFFFLLQTAVNLSISVGLLPTTLLPDRIDFAAIWIVLFLSLALADRIKLLTRDKETAQAELVHQQQELLRLSDAHAVALQDANEKLQQTLAEKVIIEQALQAYAKELERSNSELQDFAYIASHDLQEPLRKIQVFGDRLKVKYADQLSEQGQDYLSRMQNAAARMQILIQDLLVFSRVTTKAQPFTSIDLTAVVTQALQHLEIQIESLSAKIKLGELPVIQGDPAQMAQLFQNLIANSLKFHRENVPPVICIESQSMPEKKMVQISVTDNGIGFEEEYGQRIFVIFQRLHGREVYPGTGVGLAVCKKIVDRHGGMITAHGTPDEGATFTITLPTSSKAIPN